MFSPPKKIEILGQKVTIEIKTIKSENENMVIFGYYDSNEQKIVLDSNISKKQLEHTFYHEIGHALLDRSGLTNVGLSAEVQELIVEQYAKFIYENFKLRQKKRPF